MLRKSRNIFLVIAMMAITFWGYIMIVNRNTKDMTGRQKILKTVYPLLAWMNKLTQNNRHAVGHDKTTPPVSLYSLKTILNDGSVLDMASLKGKKILLVNTASDCGYTAQYDQLQQLYSQYACSMVVIGFPANDFREQEKGTDGEIASFCKKNFGVSFPLAQKSVVIKASNQNPIFQWLTDSAKNGWNSQPPSWNFCKYLVNEEGVLVDCYDAGIEPLGAEIKNAIESKP